jgi:hypothetical protein
MNFKIESIVVPTGTRKLKATWTRELAQDLSPDYVIPEKILTVKEWIRNKKMVEGVKELLGKSSVGLDLTKEIASLDALAKSKYGRGNP